MDTLVSRGAALFAIALVPGGDGCAGNNGSRGVINEASNLAGIKLREAGWWKRWQKSEEDQSCSNVACVSQLSPNDLDEMGWKPHALLPEERRRRVDE